MFVIVFSDGNSIEKTTPSPIGQVWSDCNGNPVAVVECRYNAESRELL